MSWFGRPTQKDRIEQLACSAITLLRQIRQDQINFQIRSLHIMGNVSTGVAGVQAGIELLKTQVTQLQSDSAKNSDSIQTEIKRVETIITALQGAPGDPAALQQAIADLQTLSSNLGAVDQNLQAGSTALDAERPDAPAPTA